MKYDKDCFSLDFFKETLMNIKESGYRFINFSEAMDDHTTKVVLFRHDVDFSPQRALELAKIEASNNVSSTFFFLLTCSFYNALESFTKDIIKSIIELGHEVGLHFDLNQ